MKLALPMRSIILNQSSTLQFYCLLDKHLLHYISANKYSQTYRLTPSKQLDLAMKSFSSQHDSNCLPHFYREINANQRACLASPAHNYPGIPLLLPIMFRKKQDKQINNRYMMHEVYDAHYNNATVHFTMQYESITYQSLVQVKNGSFTFVSRLFADKRSFISK